MAVAKPRSPDAYTVDPLWVWDAWLDTKREMGVSMSDEMNRSDSVTCRNCGNTGIDMFGHCCTCSAGRQLDLEIYGKPQADSALMGGVAIVGNGHPELVYLPNGAQVVPLKKMQDLLQSRPSIPIHIYINGKLLAEEIVHLPHKD